MSRNCFSTALWSEKNIFTPKKKHSPPPPPFKLNGCSLTVLLIYRHHNDILWNAPSNVFTSPRKLCSIFQVFWRCNRDTRMSVSTAVFYLHWSLWRVPTCGMWCQIWTYEPLYVHYCPFLNSTENKILGTNTLYNLFELKVSAKNRICWSTWWYNYVLLPSPYSCKCQWNVTLLFRKSYSDQWIIVRYFLMMYIYFFFIKYW